MGIARNDIKLWKIKNGINPFKKLVGGIGLNCASLVRTGAHRPLGDRRISIRLVLVVEPTPLVLRPIPNKKRG